MAEEKIGYRGHEDHWSQGSEFNQIQFVARQLVNKMATTTLVKIVRVTNAGELAPVGFVDVQPMVNQIDGDGKATLHGVIQHLPYMRMQGGANAVIMDPQVGDIGIATFASHDISSVKATRKVANPGSRRRHDWADGLYHGGVLNGLPSQVVRFDATGISLHTPGKIVLDAANVQLDVDGNLAVTGEVVRGVGGADEVTLGQHKHGTGTAVAGTSVPTAGT